MIKRVLLYALYFALALGFGLLIDKGRSPVGEILLIAFLLGIVFPLCLDLLFWHFGRGGRLLPSFGTGLRYRSQNGWVHTFQFVLALIALSIAILIAVFIVIHLGYFICVVVPTLLVLAFLLIMYSGGGGK